jgi:hypothetical protein
MHFYCTTEESGPAGGLGGAKNLVIDETFAVVMAGDDQGHHVFEVELEALESDFFVHVFNFPVGLAEELLEF